MMRRGSGPHIPSLIAFLMCAGGVLVIGAEGLGFISLAEPWRIASAVAIVWGSLYLRPEKNLRQRISGLAHQWRLGYLASFLGYAVGVPLIAAFLEKQLGWKWLSSRAAWIVWFLGLIAVFCAVAPDEAENPMVNDYDGRG